jgi:hypothetical protein
MPYAPPADDRRSSTRSSRRGGGSSSGVHGEPARSVLQQSPVKVGGGSDSELFGDDSDEEESKPMISARSEPTTAAASALSRHDSGSMKRRDADAARSDDASAKKPKQQGSYSDHDDAASRLESQGVHVSPTPGVQSDSQDDGYHSQMSVELAASIPPAAAGSARKRGAAGARHSDGGNGSRRDSEPYVRETVPAAASGVRSPVSSQDHSDPDSVRHTHAHIRTRTYSNMHIQRHAHTATRTYSDTHIRTHAGRNDQLP